MNKKHKYIVARYTYRYGVEYMSDSDYDALELELEKLGIAPEYRNRNWDEDPIPFKLLRKYGIPFYHEEEAISDTRKSTSIKKIRTYWGAVDWLNQFSQDKEVVVSLKINGISTNNQIRNDSLIKSTSRTGEMDFTEMANATFYNLKGFKENNIYAEAYIPDNIYSKNFASSRNMTLSSLQKKRNKEKIHFAVYDVSSYSISEGLYLASESGLETVPYRNYTIGEINNEEALERIVNEFADYGRDSFIPADGIVIALNDQEERDRLGADSQYYKSVCALKVGQFGAKTYKAKVLDIVMLPAKHKYSFKAKIEPTATDEVGVVEYVNLYNLDIIIKEDVTVGEEIEIEVETGGGVCVKRKN